MTFALPSIDIIEDASSEPCLSSEDALAIARTLAADPAQPFHFNSNCGHRAELMIGRLIMNDFPAAMIRRAHIHSTTPLDNSVPPVWSRKNPAGATFQNLIGTEPEEYPASYTIPDTGLRIHFLSAEEVYIWDPVNPRGNDYSIHGGYEDFEPGFALHYNGETDTRLRQHHTIALPVLNKETGLAEMKVIDPHLTTPVKLISFPEWQEIQDGENGVILFGPIGQPEHVVRTNKRTDADELQKLFNNENGYGNTNLSHDWDTRSRDVCESTVNHLIAFLEPLSIVEQKWREKFLNPEDTHDYKPASPENRPPEPS